MNDSKPAIVPAPDPALMREAEALAARAPCPARSDNVLFGTAGWTDPTLVKAKLFYPKVSMSAKDRLEFYAQHFNLVEVDATYYALPAPEVAERWVEATSAGFVFDVKAHPVLTGHPIDVARLPADIRQALEASGVERRVYPDKLEPELRAELESRFFLLIEPLIDAGRLGCVMLQFPPWFSATRGNARRIEAIAGRWQGVRFSVEFRHRSWLSAERRGRVFDMLRAQRMAYVVVDEPDVSGGGVPPVTEVTNPELSLVRFHGHNRAGWQKKGASVQERFDYLYSDAELLAWVEPVRKLASESNSVHAVFNNCVRNYAVVNAKGLAALLSEAAQR